MARAARIGIILAGGRASRMGGEKALMPFRGKPLIAYAIERARPQVDELLINTNEPERFGQFGLEIVEDQVGGFQGPLAGVLAGLDWMHANRIEAKWLATFACDAPFFPEDLVSQLVNAAERSGAFIAVAESGTQHHPVFGVWRTAISTTSAESLKFGNSRKMDDFIARYQSVRVPFLFDRLDPFFNINTPEDVARAERAAARQAKAPTVQATDEGWLTQKPKGEHSTTSLSRKGGAKPETRVLANEVPAAIEYDGQPYAVMMVTPADLEDFAVGFSLSERLVKQPSDIARVDIRSAEIGIAIDVRLEEPASERIAERQRALVGQSGCGICGIQTLEEAVPVLSPLKGAPRVKAEMLFEALSRLTSHQPLNEATGAVHAAAFCQTNGRIMTVREDVGRHNALDKLIGHLARAGTDVTKGFALLTSRCSYELVQKAVVARIPILVTISAPTELAVAIAEDTKLTLIALARPDSMLVFNNPFGVIQAPVRKKNRVISLLRSRF